MLVQQAESIILDESVYMLHLSGEIQDIALLQDEVRRCKLLADRAHETVLSGTASELQDVDPVFLVDVQICNRLSYRLGIFILDLNTEQVVRDSILLYQVIE